MEHQIKNIKGKKKEIKKVSVFIPSENKEQSWVVSPFNHYISSAKEELYKIRKPSLVKLLELLIGLLSILLKKIKIDNVIFIDNWFLTTNPIPTFKMEEIRSVEGELKKEKKAIIVRSLNEKTAKEEMDLWKNAGYELITSRQVYLFDPGEKIDNKKRRKIKKDLHLLKSKHFEIKEEKVLAEDEYRKIQELYHALYIEKYSAFNPQYTEEYFKEMHEKSCVNYVTIRKEGDIIGFIGYFVKNGIIYAPYLGYDQKMDQKEGLYRTLFIYLIQKAMKENLLFHQSAGASDFKRQRGSNAYIEYMAVYTKHLPLNKRWGWKIIQFISNKIAAPLIQKEKL